MGSCAKQLCRLTAAIFLHFPDTVYGFSVKSQGAPGSAALRGGAQLLQTKGMEDSLPPALSLEQMLGVKQATHR